MLGKGLGVPIGVDQRTINREFGYFVNVLVNIDLVKPMPDRVIIKKEGGGEFSQPVEIPKLPPFCNHCRNIGHEITQCKGLIKAIHEPAGQEKEQRGDQENFQRVQGRRRKQPDRVEETMNQTQGNGEQTEAAVPERQHEGEFGGQQQS